MIQAIHERSTKLSARVVMQTLCRRVTGRGSRKTAATLVLSLAALAGCSALFEETRPGVNYALSGEEHAAVRRLFWSIGNNGGRPPDIFPAKCTGLLGITGSRPHLAESIMDSLHVGPILLQEGRDLGRVRYHPVVPDLLNVIELCAIIEVGNERIDDVDSFVRSADQIVKSAQISELMAAYVARAFLNLADEARNRARDLDKLEPPPVDWRLLVPEAIRWNEKARANVHAMGIVKRNDERLESEFPEWETAPEFRCTAIVYRLENTVRPYCRLQPVKRPDPYCSDERFSLEAKHIGWINIEPKYSGYKSELRSKLSKKFVASCDRANDLITVEVGTVFEYADYRTKYHTSMNHADSSAYSPSLLSMPDTDEDRFFLFTGPINRPVGYSLNKRIDAYLIRVLPAGRRAPREPGKLTKEDLGPDVFEKIDDAYQQAAEENCEHTFKMLCKPQLDE